MQPVTHDMIQMHMQAYQQRSRVISHASTTFLTSWVSMQRSMRRTLEISMCSWPMELSQAVKLSSRVRKSTQENFSMLSTRFRMLSGAERYSGGQKFTPPFHNLQNVDYFSTIRGIIQNACCCIFSTDLNTIFHRKYVYIQSTRELNL